MIYLFYGEDRFSLLEELTRLKADSIPPEAEDFNFCKLDALKSGFTVDDLFNATDGFPFLSDKRLVLVSGLLAKLGKSAAAEEKAASRAAVKGRGASTTTPTSPRERFIAYLPNMPATTILVLVEEKADKREVVYKAIEKHGAVRVFEAPKDWALEKWISDRANKEKIKLERNVPALLRERLGGNLYRIHHELQKLAAYAGEGQPVTAEMVEKMTANDQESLPWALTDALSRSDLKGSLTLLNRMRNENTESQAGFNRKVFNMICKQFYDLIRIREMQANRKSVNEIAQATGMNPYRIEKTLPLTRNFQAERLDRLYSRLNELDYGDKTGRADLTVHLDLLLVEICG